MSKIMLISALDVATYDSRGLLFGIFITLKIKSQKAKDHLIK